MGIAGLMVAGIFAAAQSACSASMNSISTAFITDFIKRFNKSTNEKMYLALARIVTLIAGLLGMFLALYLSTHHVVSLWDIFIEILGLFGGVMCGLFMLGIFTKNANGKGALIGAFSSSLIVAFVQHYTPVSFLLYSVIGIVSCFFIGLTSSLFFKNDNKNIPII